MRGGQPGNAGVTLRKSLEDGPPRGVAQRRENGIELRLILIGSVFSMP